MSGGPSSKPPLPPLPPRPPKPPPPGDRPPNPRPPPPNPLPAGGLMVLRVGCGSRVSLFGERERAAKCPGRREACERARRCARRTRGEGERSTDVLRVHQEELQLGLLVSEFERRRVTFRRRERGRAWRHAHRSPRGRAARGEFLPWTVPLRVTPSGRTAPVEHTRRRVSDVARTSPDRLKVHTKRNHGACTAAGHASAAAGSRRDSGDRDASLRRERARIVQTIASIERHPHASLPARARDDVGLRSAPPIDRSPRRAV